jgi:Skp family chaperone for outer membrane proteins
VPDDSDIDLICEEYWHLDQDQAWCFEVNVYQKDINRWHREENPHHMAFLVSAAKRQRAEVKLATLSPEQQQQFANAKMNEIDSWLATETVTKVLRH